jgi:hypothetical protein
MQVIFLPVWVSHVCVFVVVGDLAAAAMTHGNMNFFRINTGVQLADMVGVVAIHPTRGTPYSLLASAVGIWMENVVIFSVLFWQVDGGGPYGRARGVQQASDWGFPGPPATEGPSAKWAPQYVDYLFLAYNTATAFSPTDALPYTHRAKALMTVESAISLVTLVVVLSRAINVLPT